MNRPKSSKRALASIVLSFEAIVVFFATLAAFGLKVAEPQLVWGVGLGVSILLILTPAVLNQKWGYYLGWLLQLVVLASGFWVWGMFIIGVILMGMWIWALIAGGTIDRARANYQKLQGDS
jgi:hypothetical protein